MYLSHLATSASTDVNAILGPYWFLPEDNCIPIPSENPKCIQTLRQKLNCIPILGQKCIPNPFMFKNNVFLFQKSNCIPILEPKN